MVSKIQCSEKLIFHLKFVLGECIFSYGHIEGNRESVGTVNSERRCISEVTEKWPLALGVIWYPDGECYASFGGQLVPSNSGGQACFLQSGKLFSKYQVHQL